MTYIFLLIFKYYKTKIQQMKMLENLYSQKKLSDTYSPTFYTQRRDFKEIKAAPKFHGCYAAFGANLLNKTLSQSPTRTIGVLHHKQSEVKTSKSHSHHRSKSQIVSFQKNTILDKIKGEKNLEELQRRKKQKQGEIVLLRYNMQSLYRKLQHLLKVYKEKKQARLTTIRNTRNIFKKYFY